MAKGPQRHPWAPAASWPLASDDTGRRPKPGYQMGENAFGVDERSRGTGPPGPGGMAYAPEDPYGDEERAPRRMPKSISGKY